MKTQISSQGTPVTPELRLLAQRQIGYALGRFESRIREVSVHLRDLNGPKGGIDKRCRVTVEFRTGGSLIATVTDVDFEPAIHRTIDRIARQVRRHCSTEQTRDRAAAARRKNETGVGE